ncbi:16S rRNA (cytidine(1402)-2'-O)-methyltransferase [Pikeienuella piscinae]|uniref:Ribosomal RNA small subunit methyltransferase I n=1 Tax=Pikeienuella piscinae TaxID=2748098 RepID=A0A7L5BVZ2_9RHOB|nr:16S rRNA (cytidine(1402)-2'-O)-methyltransferase [Pikeienuella piscinae]QIE55293.1 16S rRNA (cytidine(1402)-2'-O)-methyltransferase [Pikeienuella piscinae]
MARTKQSKRGPAGETSGSGAPPAVIYSRDRLPAGLYLAATPIGAAGDVTLRALDALTRADAIAAEDTRRALKLMSIHGVPRAGRPLIAYHDHNGEAVRPGILARIEAGESVVCVTDAGTPLIADPGWKLAEAAIGRGLKVVALPGASAVLAALSVAGLPTDRFMFAGFTAPKQAARRADLAALKAVPATLVFYESPRRLGALLADMTHVFGGERRAAVCRELTKLHEEVRRGTLAALAENYDGSAPKGEIVVCVGPPEECAPGADETDAALRAALREMGVRDAATTVAGALGLPRRAVYARALALTTETDET